MTRPVGAVSMIALAATVAPVSPVAVNDHQSLSSGAYPPGCYHWALGNEWGRNCWAGQNLNNSSDLVLGVQSVVKYFCDSREGINYQFYRRDGKYGASTATYVAWWQQDYNDRICGSVRCISQDGIVGPGTWGAMGEIVLMNLNHATADYKYYQGQTNAGFPLVMKRGGSSDGRWYVATPDFRGYRHMSYDSGPPY